VFIFDMILDRDLDKTGGTLTKDFRISSMCQVDDLVWPSA